MKRDYPEQPIVGVGAIIVRRKPEVMVRREPGVMVRRQPRLEMVLVKRGNPPLRGEWTIPGGALELGELLEAGACREALEETGLHVRPSGGIEVFDRIVRDASGAVEFHYVLLDYHCEVTGGELRAGDDVEAARWFGADELETPGISEFTASIVRRVLADSSR